MASPLARQPGFSRVPASTITPHLLSLLKRAIDIADTTWLTKLLLEHNITDCPEALQYASALGRIECLRVMEGRGANLGCRDMQGKTLLHYACPARPACVRYLLGQGLSANDADRRGSHAVHWAGRCRMEECRLLLLHHDSHYHHGHSPTFPRRGWNAPGVPHWPQHLKGLRKADMHVQDHHTHRTDCLLALAEAGADLSAKEQRGRSVLHFAAWCNQLPVARLLLDAGIDADVTDDYDETPLHFAAHMGNVSMIRLLLCRGANINALNRDHETPLHIAVSAWHEPAVRLLLEWGASTTLRDGTFTLTAQEAAANQKLPWAEELFASRGPVPTLQMLCRLFLCKNNSQLYGCRNNNQGRKENETLPVCMETERNEMRNGKSNGGIGLHCSESDLKATNGNGATATTTTTANGFHDTPSGNGLEEGESVAVGVHHGGSVFDFNSSYVSTNHHVPLISTPANPTTQEGAVMHASQIPSLNALSNQLRPLSLSTSEAKTDSVVSTNQKPGSRVWNVDGSVDYRVPRRLDGYLGMSEELQSAMVG